MKTERVVLLVTAELKEELERKARQKGVSLSEYIRVRCESPDVPQDLVELGEMVAELRSAIERDRSAVAGKLEAVQTVLEKMRAEPRRAKPGPRTT